MPSHHLLKAEMFRKEAQLLVGSLDNLKQTFIDMNLSTEPIEGNIDGLAFKIQDENGHLSYIVWIKEDARNPLIVLAHELIHLTFYLLDDVGVKVAVDNDETFAYLFEHLLKQGKKYLEQQPQEGPPKGNVLPFKKVAK